MADRAVSGYTKWKGKPIGKARPSKRSDVLKEEAREIAEAHRRLKQDFLGRERKRKAVEKQRHKKRKQRERKGPA